MAKKAPRKFRRQHRKKVAKEDPMRLVITTLEGWLQDSMPKDRGKFRDLYLESDIKRVVIILAFDLLRSLDAAHVLMSNSRASFSFSQEISLLSRRVFEGNLYLQYMLEDKKQFVRRGRLYCAEGLLESISNNPAAGLSIYQDTAHMRASLADDINLIHTEDDERQYAKRANMAVRILEGPLRDADRELVTFKKRHPGSRWYTVCTPAVKNLRLLAERFQCGGSYAVMYTEQSQKLHCGYEPYAAYEALASPVNITNWVSIFVSRAIASLRQFMTGKELPVAEMKKFRKLQENLRLTERKARRTRQKR